MSMRMQMDDRELISALGRMVPETGSLICLGCGHERKCSIHGCAILREAVSRLKDLTAPSPNPPLTLDELREMDGEPVWVETPGAREYGRWAVVEGVSYKDQALYLIADFTCCDYGKAWLAYRRKPEEEGAHE